jgi:hypothetical protein
MFNTVLHHRKNHVVLATNSACTAVVWVGFEVNTHMIQR